MKNFVTKDSGQRTEFPGGSVRDLGTGKGRYDLIPWEVVVLWAQRPLHTGSTERDLDYAMTGAFGWLNRVGDLGAIVELLGAVADHAQGPREKSGILGLQWPIIERWAKLMERGAEKYGARNWEIGQPLARFFDSGIRHLYQWYFGLNTEEDHLAAVFYNFGAIVWTTLRIEDGTLPAELDDRHTAAKITFK